MVEVEFKFACDDADKLRAWLLDMGAESVHIQTQSDEYLNDPLRDFSKSDKALRIRSVDGQFELTFKGPNLDLQAKIRQEINLPLASEEAAEDLRSAFLGMDFVSVAKVLKRRETWHLNYQSREIAICLDDVAEVGAFCELELLVEEAGVAEAKACLSDLAKEMNLTNSIRTSYLEMLLKKRGEM